MILNLKTPVYDNHTGNVIVGEEATYDEVCAFAGKFVKQRCLMLTPIGNQTTLLYFQNFSLYYNSEDKTLELSPSTAFDKFYRVKGWNELMRGGVAHV